MMIDEWNCAPWCTKFSYTRYHVIPRGAAEFGAIDDDDSEFQQSEKK